MSPPFQLFAAHPALDLVNTLDNRFIAAGPIERLTNYEDLLAFMRQCSLMDLPRVTALARHARASGAASALRAARELREALAAVFYGPHGAGAKPPPHVVRTLERHFHAAGDHRELIWQRDAKESATPLRAQWEWGRSETNLKLPVWILAQSAETLLTSSAIDQVHMCSSESCRWLFLDASKNHSRRWCNMKICGNRVKVRRFHARRQQRALGAPR
jgi:predicted RNA-binding Zn ribbon-like protein